MGTPLRPGPARHWKAARIAAAGSVVVYLAVACLLMPGSRVRYVRPHPSLENIPRGTCTGDDFPSGPRNVALIGTESQFKAIMLTVAAPLTGQAGSCPAPARACEYRDGALP